MLYVGERPRMKGTWKDGAQDGFFYEYSAFTGNVTFEGNYKAGVREGQGCEFDPITKAKVFEGKWSCGCYWEGKGAQFQGEKKVEFLWSNGQCISAKEFHDAQLVFEGEYQDN